MERVLWIRLSAFAGIFVLMALWEAAAPRRRLTVAKPGRWFTNLSIIGLDNALVFLVAPGAAVATAVAAQAAGWGLLNRFLLPGPAAVVVGVLALDLVIYLQHLMFHAVPLLWRLHMVHHADLDIDVTTGLRFHPVEILVSLGIKVGAVAAIGPPVAAVVIFEVLLNATSMFNHGNVRMPPRLDRVFRLLVVTPDMHRVHHSVAIRETNSNFGFNFPWWDRIFGTYRAQPAAGHRGMTIGLAQFRDPSRLGFVSCLLLPVTGDPGAYAIDKSGMEPVRRERPEG
ncbi:sterol desaturase family protein [Dissulfurirhabdus thermomarina]|uniref:Sterol desaturase family protein n=1 Tax=Dissulfurirhabdus thermomarina TaxID=1765737 RepID=A0A6N9TPN6_DISTH|nr:sterol desaturase family protein [Dissulfurirhabdus thermomarina]NDY43008.1 sterol desaturase family protein [Dissulfurirhabdus thermomarina]NMX23829.1 sterol desaturase family protein [Dissulfurirhabdus thermomarina]